MCVIAVRFETSSSNIQSDSDPKFKGKAVVVFWGFFGLLCFVAGR